jgi:RHS repeat-associated protein
VEATFTSLPFGDAQAQTTAGGSDLDPYHYASLDYDSESNTSHAQFRQYSSTQGHWMSPDPYSGSYDSANPQSMNRYAYVMNNPLSYLDTSGLQCVTFNNGVVGDDGTDPPCNSMTQGNGEPDAEIWASLPWYIQEYGLPPNYFGNIPKPTPPDPGPAPNNPSNPNSPKSCADKLANIENLVNATRTNGNPGGFKGLAQRFRQMNRPGYDDAGHMEQIANRQAQLQSAIDDYKGSGCGDPPSSAAGYATQPIANPWPRVSSSTLKYGAIVVGGAIIVGGVVILCPECLLAAPAFAF